MKSPFKVGDRVRYSDDDLRAYRSLGLVESLLNELRGRVVAMRKSGSFPLIQWDRMSEKAGLDEFPAAVLSRVTRREGDAVPAAPKNPPQLLLIHSGKRGK